MMQYIDKDVLVAWIDRIKKSIGSDRFLSEFEKGCNQGKEDVCDDLHAFLNTIEVKNVDLEKEFDNYAKDILACDVQFEPFTHLYNCAKYFYKLGLVQKGE